MKTSFVIVLAFLLGWIPTFGQSGKPSIALNVGLVNNYHLPAKSSQIRPYYGLGGKIQVVFNDKWWVGYAQNTSLAPKDLLKTAAPEYKKSNVSEYTLSLGRQWNIGANLYFLTSARVGINDFQWQAKHTSDWDEIIHAKSNTSFLVAPEAGIGFNLNKYLALEAGMSYRKHFKNEKLPIIAAKDLNSLGFSIALLGTIDLTK